MISSFSLLKSVTYNNAGVRCLLAGKLNPACDLFKASLEFKYAFETGLDYACVQSGPTEVLLRAEYYLHNLETVLSEDFHLSTMTAKETPTALATVVSTDDGIDRDPLALHLCTVPILIDESCFQGVDSLQRDTVESRTASATIIFNLALLEHCHCPGSLQANTMYELALLLISISDVSLLVLSLVNNLGVWRFENGDARYAQIFMGCLSRLLEDYPHCLPAKVRARLESNIQRVLPFSFYASPAA